MMCRCAVTGENAGRSCACRATVSDGVWGDCLAGCNIRHLAINV